MKKIWIWFLIPILSSAAFLVYQNLPEKRYARHLIKARLFAKEDNLTAAQQEYERAYASKQGFTPYVSLEVVQLTVRRSLQDRNLPEALANARKFVAAHPANAEGQLLLAGLAYRSGDLEGTFAALNAILESDPANFPARLLMTRIRTAQGRLDLAEEQLRILYRDHPDSTATLLPLAGNLLRQGRVAESRVFLRQILADDPRQHSAMLMLIDSYLRERKPDSAQELLDRWASGSDSAMDSQEAAAITIRRARFESQMGRGAEAKARLAPLCKPRMGNPEAMAGLAAIHATAADYDSAIAMYAVLAETKPESKPMADRYRTLLFLKNQNPARALEAAKTAQVESHSRDMLLLVLAAYLAIGQDNKAADLIQAQPDSARAGLQALVSRWEPDRIYIGQWALVQYFQALEDRLRALEASRELHGQWPRNVLARELHTANLIAVRDYAAAARLMESAGSGSDPARNRALIGLYLNSGQKGKAKTLAERCLAANPGPRDLKGLNAILADLAWSRGDKENGIRYSEAELKVNPNDGVVLNNLAWEYGIARNDFAKAAPYLERLRARKFQDARVLDTIGWILVRNGRAEEGERSIRQALNLVPDRPSFLYHMGAVRFQAGHGPDAKGLIQRALDSRFPFEERKDAEALLARL